MGKDWLYWVGGGGGGGSGRSTTREERLSGEKKEAAAATSAGCMCSVFQLFDLHHLQFPLNQQQPSSFHPDSPLQEEATTSKGLEAPRNSLELDETAAMNVTSMPLEAMNEQESLNFPVGIHIRTGHERISPPRVSTTSASKSRTDDISSEYSSSSPGTKTPTLVARLMGLDLLPECSSPSFSKPQTNSGLHKNYHRKHGNILQTKSNRSFFDDDISVGARSLPETPRISSARRSDVEYHRLSLQMNKENTNEDFPVSAKMVCSRRGRFKQQLTQDENRTPRHYAKQIVKQVKESVSKRVGLTDITNTNKNKGDYSRNDANLILLKPIKKKSEALSRFEGEIIPQSKNSVAPSCSPRLRFSETNKNKQAVRNPSTKNPRISGPSFHSHLHSQRTVKSESVVPFQDHGLLQKDSKKIGSGKCSSTRLRKLPPQASDHAIRNKKKDPFFRSTARNESSLADKKFNKTPFSSGILNISGPTLLPVKKIPSPPATKLPQKQSHASDALASKRSTQLSSNSSHSYNPDKLFTVPPDNSNGCATTSQGGAAAEYKNYIQRILRRAGVADGLAPLTLPKWHTLSRPLDPSIFHYLELFDPITTSSAGGGGVLSRRCNRKLIFQLVDELLAKTLRPHLGFKTWVSSFALNHNFPMVDKLCKKILSFPSAHCEVLQDIDALIDTDMCDRFKFLEEEMECIVGEIEGEIMEALVRETAAMVGVRTSEEERQRLTDVTLKAST